jgi:hypothetical protein
LARGLRERNEYLVFRQIQTGQSEVCVEVTLYAMSGAKPSTPGPLLIIV